MSSAEKTTDHEVIKAWVEERGERPARVAQERQGSGILRIDFQEPDELSEEISWEEFFEVLRKTNSPFCIRTRHQVGRRVVSSNLLTVI